VMAGPVGVLFGKRLNPDLKALADPKHLYRSEPL
jgi:hypothetical protein